MFSKREAESYLLVDHRQSPGVSTEEAAATGFTCMPVGRGRMYESASCQCTNCERLIVINPLRTSERFYCQKCDGYHCDQCALNTKISGVCKPFKQLIEDLRDAIVKGHHHG